MKPPSTVRLTPGKRVLFLTKDPELIRRQMRGELDMQMKDIRGAGRLDGIRIAVAASFAPIHAGNNINQGLLMADHGMLARLQAGEGIAIDELCKGHDAISQLIIKEGGLFPFSKAIARGDVAL